MDDFDAVLAHRLGEREVVRKPRRCQACDQVRDDIDLTGEDTETGERFYECAECVAKQDRAALESQGLKVVCLVAFDGRATPDCLPYGWFTQTAYGCLLEDGRVFWGDREVKPQTYQRV